MPDLLLELFSEEIPARMQRRAADDLRKLVTDALVEAGLVYDGAKAFATPRRLALTVHGLPARSPDRREERKGPRVGAPEKAIEGFLKAAGLASIAEAKVQEDKKGDFYVAVIEKPGRTAGEVIAEIVPKVVRAFPWPKSMRWGAASAKPGSLAWVRPLHSILCVFGPETEETEVVDFEIDGIRSGRVTRGHRFMAPAPIAVRRFDDYVAKLEKAKVVLDTDRRKAIILADARNAAHALGLDLVEDEALLEEVAGLVEWPVVLVGEFEKEFLFLPPEVIRTTIRANQKCFVLRRLEGANAHPPLEGEGRAEGAGWGEGANATPSRSASRPDLPPPGGGGRLAPRFVMVANLEASDGGKAIVAGNGRVIRARLSDAQHFWETDLYDLPDLNALREAADRLGVDLAKPLDQRMAKLAATDVVFHDKLGTQGARVERIAQLAREIAPLVGADPDKAERAAKLAKADLVTEMVGEFPELQGLMGRYYAEEQNEDISVAAAIEDHYKPVGPSDRVPADPVAIAVALADKLDLLVGFWAIDEKPTGSKDPYALRRAALGVIRVVLSGGIRLPLLPVLEFAERQHFLRGMVKASDRQRQLADELIQLGVVGAAAIRTAAVTGSRTMAWIGGRLYALEIPDLLAFFADRLKVQLREQGARHDLVDAVFALGAYPPLEGEGRAEGAGWGGEKESTPSRRASPVDLPPPGGGGASAHSTESAEPSHPDRPADAARSDPGSSPGQALSPPGRGEGAHPPLEGEGRAEGAGWGGEKESTPSRSASRSDLPPPGGGGASASPQDDLVLIVRRVEALGRFLDTEDGKNLLAGYKRATNILREEEKKTGERYDGVVDPHALVEPEEKALFEAIGAATGEARAAVELEDFDGAMSALAKLRPAVDAFFEHVLVNAPDKAVRANRLRLLDKIRAATLTVADFSKVGG